ncbi:MAG: dipeptidase [Marinilabiliales bacterium]|mgnify:CR=1 FL=1|nr:MAG: dipeptidase [Marinilabiliales bacterium]
MKKNIFILIVGLVTLAPFYSKACTNYLVTKGASEDGSTMISYAADSHIRYGELYWRPAGTWPEGSMITLYDRGTAKPLGQIPQAAVTYQVIGFMNEHQVSIGETTYGGRHELMDSLAIVDYGSLMFLALQRSTSAREAIKVMFELVSEYGYASSGESFSIADKNEVWILEMISKGCEPVWDKKQKKYINKNKGAVWVAIRIPDGYVSAHANQARITNFKLSDGKTSISTKEIDKIFNPEVEIVYADDVISFAKEKGYFEGEDKDFSFSDAYAPLSYGGARFCELRVWAFFNEISDDMSKYWEHAIGNDLNIRMPLYIKPNKKLSPADLMSYKRNHLEGTDLDMSKDYGAGPFGLPYRWRPLTWDYDSVTYCNERVTATQQTGFSFISQMRSWLPDPIGGVFWFGVDDAASCVYVPFYCGITKTPKKWSEGYGDILTYKDDAAFWVFNRVAHFAYLFYNRVMPDLTHQQALLENKFFEYQPLVDQSALELYSEDPEKGKEYLTDYCVSNANYVVDYWKEFGEWLLVKYLDGNIKQEENGEFLRNPWGYPKSPKFPGYPDSWKEDLIEETGDQFKMR